MAAVDDLAERTRQLATEAIEHKSAIRWHRRRLGEVTAALAALEQECRRRGIGFTQEQAHGTHRNQSSAN